MSEIEKKVADLAKEQSSISILIQTHYDNFKKESMAKDPRFRKKPHGNP